MGQHKASEMRFRQFWNPPGGDKKEGRNYSERVLIYDTPDGEQSICLSINVEEGIVYLEETERVNNLFVSEEEKRSLIASAQKDFDENMDMGTKGSHFIYGYGGTKYDLYEHDNPNIEYIKLVFPDNEKFQNPSYKNKVEWSLIDKGAVVIVPKDDKRKPYFAVIQRKHKPRDLTPFRQFLPEGVLNPVKNTPSTKEKKIENITMPKWLAKRVGLEAKTEHVTYQTVIEDKTEKAVLIVVDGKKNWLPKSQIQIS